MKTNPDPSNEDALLEAVLRDDAWQAAAAAGKAAALGVFQARQRLRRITRWGATLVMLALVAAVTYWTTRPSPKLPSRQTAKASEGTPKPASSKYLTDGELVALFPPGSCFLAEVDGQKKLVFFDPAVERQYVSYGPGPQRSFQ